MSVLCIVSPLIYRWRRDGNTAWELQCTALSPLPSHSIPILVATAIWRRIFTLFLWERCDEKTRPRYGRVSTGLSRLVLVVNGVFLPKQNKKKNSSILSIHSLSIRSRIDFLRNDVNMRYRAKPCKSGTSYWHEDPISTPRIFIPFSDGSESEWLRQCSQASYIILGPRMSNLEGKRFLMNDNQEAVR